MYTETQSSQIFTSYLGISHVFLSHEDYNVTLVGCYGDLLDGEMRPINVLSSFDVVNDLIRAEGEDNDEAVDLIAKALSAPSMGTEPIDLMDIGGLHFHKFFFSFLMMREDGDALGQTDEDETVYWLNACIEKQGHMEDFVWFRIPESKAKRMAYYQQILAMQYRLYLCCCKTMSRENARIASNLNNPIYFAIAKLHFQLGG